MWDSHASIADQGSVSVHPKAIPNKHIPAQRFSMMPTNPGSETEVTDNVNKVTPKPRNIAIAVP